MASGNAVTEVRVSVFVILCMYDTRPRDYEFHSTTTDVQPAVSSSDAAADSAVATSGGWPAVRVQRLPGPIVWKLHVAGGDEAVADDAGVPDAGAVAEAGGEAEDEALHARGGGGEGERDREEDEADEPDAPADQEPARPGSALASVLQRSDEHDAAGAADGLLQVDSGYHEGRGHVDSGPEAEPDGAGPVEPGGERRGLRLPELDERDREHEEDPAAHDGREDDL